MESVSNQFINVKLYALRGRPRHRLLVELNGQQTWAWNLVSVDQAHRPERAVLCLDHPDSILPALSPDIQEKWAQFNKALSRLREEWQFGSVATLKRVIREHRTSPAQFLPDFDLRTICYRHGAIPALAVGEIPGTDDNPWIIALLPERFEREQLHRLATDDEKWEILESLNMFLPHLLTQYYENITNYLIQIFFGGNDQQVMRYCLRIRQIIEQSIYEKLHLIENCSDRFAKAYALSNELKTKYALAKEEAHVVCNFAHLLVNYIYRFFCIRDRIDIYAARLAKLRHDNGLVEEGQGCVTFIKRCTEHLTSLSDPEPFLHALDVDSGSRPGWLQRLGEVSAMVTEIARYTATQMVDIPRVFISHHFHVVESERFRVAMETMASSNANFITVTGRRLPKHIRWSVLARIWLSDHQVFFLPASSVKTDGTFKQLTKPKEDWVTLELLYGMFIERPQTFIVGTPFSEEHIEQYRQHLCNYTEEKEIPQIDDIVWNDFIHGTKQRYSARQRLSNYLHNREYISCDANNVAASWSIIEQDVIRQSGLNLLATLCAAWSYFFNSEDWSIAQVLIESNKNMTIADIREVVNTMVAIGKSQFRWALHLSEKQLTDAVRRRTNKISEFAFIIEGQAYEPVVARKHNGKIVVKARHGELWDKLAERFGIVLSQQYIWEIKRAWMERGPDSGDQ